MLGANSVAHSAGTIMALALRKKQTGQKLQQF